MAKENKFNIADPNSYRDAKLIYYYVGYYLILIKGKKRVRSPFDGTVVVASVYPIQDVSDVDKIKAMLGSHHESEVNVISFSRFGE